MKVQRTKVKFFNRPVAAHSGTVSKKKKSSRRNNSFGTLVFSIIIIAALIWGWLNKGTYLTPEKGLGYYLGIAGAVAMLTLLTYPMRKRIPFFRRAGSIRAWFSLHMALGIIGPTLILYHANFGLGSINGDVALWSMLIVAGSGMAGRFFYAKIHRGLYGKRAEVRELMTEATQFRENISKDIKTADLLSKIDQLETDTFKPVESIIQAGIKSLSTTSKIRKLKRLLNRQVKHNLKKAKKIGDINAVAQSRAHLSFTKKYFKRLEQAADLALYERLFAAWHVLHIPLFFLLIITAVIHVVAVHLY